MNSRIVQNTREPEKTRRKGRSRVEKMRLINETEQGWDKPFKFLEIDIVREGAVGATASQNILRA